MIVQVPFEQQAKQVVGPDHETMVQILPKANRATEELSSRESAVTLPQHSKPQRPEFVA